MVPLYDYTKYPVNFNQIVHTILVEEGILSNDKTDPGGLTKWGIASASFPQVKNPSFSIEDAVQIYYLHFYVATYCNKLDYSWALPVFNAAVQHGVSQAIKFLQITIGVVADGNFGPKSAAALAKTEQNIEGLVEFFAQEAAFYENILYFNPDEYHTMIHGWRRRQFKIAMLSQEV